MKLIDLLYNPPDKQVFCGEKTDYEAWEKQIKDLFLEALPHLIAPVTQPDNKTMNAFYMGVGRNEAIAEMRRRIEEL